MKLRNGTEVPLIRKQEAEARSYLTDALLDMMHLMPEGNPVGYLPDENGNPVYYYDPARVTAAPVERWGKTAQGNPPQKAPAGEPVDPVELESGKTVGRLNIRRAAQYGYYTKERLAVMHFETAEEPVAYARRADGSVLYLYDKETATRLPLPCVKCGQDVRYQHKLCRACYEAEMAVRRAEGDAHRAAAYHMDRARVLFFDLELTGVYDHDEIISISIVDANGKQIMDTLVHPVHTKRWKRTEKIHGITPAMVADSPTLESLVPEIKRIFAEADNLIAFGVSTDYSHICKIYETQEEREALRRKTRCCANEFVRFAHEHEPDLTHMSLTDAMAYYGIAWDGVAHSSIADTIGCMKVWEKIFPAYYEN